MISSRTDYQYITPVGVVDGGILPARDFAADGSKLTLRAEDLCFSLEAVYERLSVNNNTPYRAMPLPSLAINQDDWVNLWANLASAVFTGHDDGTEFASDDSRNRYTWISAIDPLVVFSDVDLPEQSDYRWLTDTFPNVVLTSRYVGGSGIRPGHVWYNDYVRGFYYDLQRSDRLLLGGGLWPISGTLTHTHHDEDDNITTTENVTRFIDTAAFDYVYRTGRKSGRKRRYDGYTGGSMSFTLPLHQKAASAELLVVDRVSAIYHPYDDSQTTTIGRFKKFNVTWDSAGVVTIPASAWQHTEADLESIAAEFNLAMPFTTTSFTVPGELRVSVDGIWLVVRYDFRTEIRSLGWQWTP